MCDEEEDNEIFYLSHNGREFTTTKNDVIDVCDLEVLYGEGPEFIEMDAERNNYLNDDDRAGRGNLITTTVIEPDTEELFRCNEIDDGIREINKLYEEILDKPCKKDRNFFKYKNKNMIS